MGFFYWKAEGSDGGYLRQIENVNFLGAPKDFVQDIDLLWGVCLRLANYNPVEADKILEQSSAKQIYEAYVIYAFDKFPDDA